jgi:hypothetical protein
MARTHEAAHAMREASNKPAHVTTPVAKTATASTAEKIWTASVFIVPFLRH